MTGNVAQWSLTGDEVGIEVLNGPEEKNGAKILDFDDYRLWKFYSGDKIPVWPLFEKTIEAKRYSPLTGELLHTYRLRAREAKYESDFKAIAELEQYHYASQKEKVASWRCENGPDCRTAKLRKTFGKKYSRRSGFTRPSGLMG